MQTKVRFINLVLCSIIVMGMLGCAGSRTRESTGEYIDDSVITTKAKAALLADEEVSGLQVQVETFKGVVQLSGFVDTAAQAQKAAEIVRTVKGVQEVKNHITVK
jgi:hyperosmotically inducible periplasmic protein